MSGGIDSSVLLAYFLKQNHEVSTIGFTYGSKHNDLENTSARNIANHYHVPFDLIDITSAMYSFKSNLFLRGGEIPKNHYNDASMKATVVPSRNMIFISILAGLAESHGQDTIALGAHKGDHHIYPDCRKDFMDAVDQSVYLSSNRKVHVSCPFIDKNKTDIVRLGIELSVPFQLTRTCYTPYIYACRECGSCIERLEAFANNDVSDPIGYAGVF